MRNRSFRHVNDIYGFSKVEKDLRVNESSKIKDRSDARAAHIFTLIMYFAQHETFYLPFSLFLLNLDRTFYMGINFHTPRI